MTVLFPALDAAALLGEEARVDGALGRRRSRRLRLRQIRRTHFLFSKSLEWGTWRKNVHEN